MVGSYHSKKYSINVIAVMTLNINPDNKPNGIANQILRFLVRLRMEHQQWLKRRHVKMLGVVAANIVPNLATSGVSRLTPGTIPCTTVNQMKATMKAATTLVP
jgi:hypothetical protein